MLVSVATGSCPSSMSGGSPLSYLSPDRLLAAGLLTGSDIALEPAGDECG